MSDSEIDVLSTSSTSDAEEEFGTNIILLDPEFIPPPPPPPPRIQKIRENILTRGITSEIVQAASLPPPLASVSPKNNLSSSISGEIKTTPPTPPPRRNMRPISTPPGALNQISKLLKQPQSQQQTETNDVDSNNSEPKKSSPRVPPPRPPRNIKKSSNVPTVPKASSIPQRLTPRSVAKFTENSVASSSVPLLSPHREHTLIPFETNIQEDIAPDKHQKQRNRKSLPNLARNTIGDQLRSSTPATFGLLSGIDEQTSEQEQETKICSPVRPPPPPPPPRTRKVVLIHTKEEETEKTKVSFTNEAPKEKTTDNRMNVISVKSDKSDKPEIPLLHISSTRSQMESPPMHHKTRDKLKKLQHTLSSPDLNKVQKTRIRGPVRAVDMDDIDSEDDSEPAALVAQRSDTYSNVNWEDLESQIMESPVEEILLSARGNRAKDRWNQYLDTGTAHSVESQRMRRFAFGSTNEHSCVASMNDNTKSYEELFNGLVEEHRNAVTARGTNPLRQTNDPAKSSPDSTAPRPRRSRASSTAGLSKIIKTPIPDTTEPVKEGKERKKKKKTFKNLIKGNKGADVIPDTGPIEMFDYAAEGRKTLAAIRARNPDLSLEEFIAEIKAQSTLPVTLKNTNIGALYFDEFEADESTAIEHTDNDPSNLTYATIFKLIQRLSLPESLDALLRSIFLLTYRSFVTSKELMELFICRAFGTPPPTYQEAYDAWSTKQLAIQNRILIVVGTWVGEYFASDFATSDEALYLLAHFTHFIESNPRSAPYATLLLCGIGQNVAPQDEILKGPTGKKQKIPKPHLPKVTGTMKLVNFNPTEVARQLALVEKSIFDRISPGEYAHQGWTRDDKLTRSPNIVAMIERFNNICNWTASEILREPNLKERAVILHRLIIIAEESRALCNFNAVMAIISGLQSAPIYRLRDTWDLLPSKTWDIWDELNELMSNEQNFSNYRAALSEATETKTPCVPYIGIFLTDLVFVEDGNLDFKPDTTLINLKKLRFASSVLFRLEKCKPPKYRLTPVWSLQGYIVSRETFSEEQQRELSMQLQGLG